MKNLAECGILCHAHAAGKQIYLLPAQSRPLPARNARVKCISNGDDLMILFSIVLDNFLEFVMVVNNNRLELADV